MSKKSWMLGTVAGLALLGLGAAVLPVVAQTTPPDGGPGHHWHHQPGGMLCRDREAHLAGMLAYVQARLKLGADQQAGWTTLTTAIRNAEAPLDQACAQAGKAEPASLPDRLAEMERFEQARLASMQQILPAISTFYQTLTPEQKQTADRMMMGHHHPPE